MLHDSAATVGGELPVVVVDIASVDGFGVVVELGLLDGGVVDVVVDELVLGDEVVVLDGGFGHHVCSVVGDVGFVVSGFHQVCSVVGLVVSGFHHVCDVDGVVTVVDGFVTVVDGVVMVVDCVVDDEDVEEPALLVV